MLSRPPPNFILASTIIVLMSLIGCTVTETDQEITTAVTSCDSELNFTEDSSEVIMIVKGNVTTNIDLGFLEVTAFAEGAEEGQSVFVGSQTFKDIRADETKDFVIKGPIDVEWSPSNCSIETDSKIEGGFDWNISSE